MNLNNSFRNKKDKIGAEMPGFQRTIMGPPAMPAPKRKTKSSVSSATNWGRRTNTLFNNSTLRSASTSTSAETEFRIFMAITEGRGDARCEVGLASINISHPTLILCQISDSQSYVNTLTKINILNPSDIIVPATFLENADNSRLIKKLRKQFPNIKLLSLPRKSFNKTNGMDRILKLCLPSLNTICVGLQHKYYCLAAASALLIYLQNYLNIYYATASLNILYQQSEGYAVIDVSTADRLELVSSTKPAQASRFSTLFGVLNYCETKVGARLLRSTILQPPCSSSIIEQTTNCISELLKYPHVMTSVQSFLQKISTIHQLLTISSITYENNAMSSSVRQLNYLLLLNGFIDLIEPLKSVIEPCQESFFQDLKDTLENGEFVVISEQIRSLIHPSAKFAKADAGEAQRCFAIRSGVNGLLDLVRKTYSERLNDMSNYVKEMSLKYNLNLAIANNNTKGYHIVLKLKNHQKKTFNKSDLPAEFIQVYRLTGSFTMKTQELLNYATRLDYLMVEILKISNGIISKTVMDLKPHIGLFYKLCEEIARLDLYQSLAEASRRGNYIRPKWNNFTELKQARHPMLERLIGEQSVSNPITICKDFNLQLVTGPNGSGKSIYIRQVMLLQIMAQTGSYIPAESAIMRPMNRMFARIYLEDNMEFGASCFILEMKEIKYMMSLASENSLFIVDEICRSTSAEEGSALAMALCEDFAKSSSFVYVTSHYLQLAKLSELYLNVQTWQMETIATGTTPRDLSLDFKYNLIPGVTEVPYYGMYLAKNIFPKSVLTDAYNILNSLKENVLVDKQVLAVDPMIRLKYQVTCDLRKLKSSGRLTMGTAISCLIDYQNRLKALGVSININNINILQEQSDESGNNQNMNHCQPEASIQSTPCGSNQFNIFEPHISLDLEEPGFDNQRSQEESSSDYLQANRNFNYINSNSRNYSAPGDEVSSWSGNINKESTHWGISADDIQSFIDDFAEDEQFLQSQVSLSTSDHDPFASHTMESAQYQKSVDQDFFLLNDQEDIEESTNHNDSQMVEKPISNDLNYQSLREFESTSTRHDSFVSEDNFAIESIEDEPNSTTNCEPFGQQENGILYTPSNQLDEPNFFGNISLLSDEQNVELSQSYHLNDTQVQQDHTKTAFSASSSTSKNTFFSTRKTPNNFHFFDQQSLPESRNSHCGNKEPIQSDAINKQNFVSNIVQNSQPDSFYSCSITSSLNQMVLNKDAQDEDFENICMYLDDFEKQKEIQSKTDNFEDSGRNESNQISLSQWEAASMGVKIDVSEENTPSCAQIGFLENNEDQNICEQIAQNSEDCTIQSSFVFNRRKYNQQHIFPVVNIVQGQSWSSESSTSWSSPKICEDEAEENFDNSQTISYSPLKSPPKSVTDITNFWKIDQKNLGKDETIMNINLDKKEENHEDITTTETLEKTFESSNSTKTFEKNSEQNCTNHESSIPAKPTLVKKIFIGRKGFKPPKKLTKKEIEKEFAEQNKKLYEVEITDPEFSKQLSLFLKRPTVKQIQQAEHLTFVRKTPAGVEEVPFALEPQRKKQKKNALTPHLSASSDIDITMFSDKNAKCFDQFVNSKEKDFQKFKLNACNDNEKTEANPFLTRSEAVSAANPFKTVSSRPDLFSETVAEANPFLTRSKTVLDYTNNLPINYLQNSPEAPLGVQKNHLDPLSKPKKHFKLSLNLFETINDQDRLSLS